MLLRTVCSWVCACAAITLSADRAGAVVLDWDAVGNGGWLAGSLNNTYQADLSNADSFISIDVAPNSGAPLVPYSVAPNPMTPLVQPAFQGGLATTENSLTIAVNLANALQSVTITISFLASGGASDVSFSLFDIDAGGGAQDQLSQIRALSIDGTTWIAPTITAGPDTTVVGTGLAAVVNGVNSTPSTGLTSGRGNVRFDFGSAQVQYVTFTFGDTTAFADPAYQHFAIHDVSFTPVPEANPAVASVFSCLAAAALIFRHRAAKQK